jgi:alpha-ketoglutarate-dependent 2,4-dichlorophenoxyacetate dioxygenase
LTLQFAQLHPLFVAEVRGVDVARPLEASVLAELTAAVDRYGVLVFRGQVLTDERQVAFASRFGPLENYGTLNSRKRPPRLASPEIADVSNLKTGNEPYGKGSAQRMHNLANQLWHTDSSFKHPPGHLSMLSAHAVPSWGGETQFADMRAAWDALPERTKAQVDGLVAEHSLLHSRESIGFTDMPQHIRDQLPAVAQPLVRTHPGSGRKSLYIASHASHILGMPVPEGRLLLADLMAHATQREFVHTHEWRVGDLVLWDNRCTMHRGRPFDEAEPRDMRRTTTSDVGFMPELQRLLA